MDKSLENIIKEYNGDMTKRKICVFTNWYPTKDNPYQGLFLREQAIALSDYYDFIIVHYGGVETKFLKKPNIEKINAEHNIEEYKINIFYSHNERRVYKYIFRRLDYFEDIEKKSFEYIANNYKELFNDVDIYYSISCQSESYISNIFSKIYNKSYVITEHGPFPWIGTLISKRNKDAIENADLFLAISNDKIRQILMQDIKLPIIKYVGNMVDDSLFKYKKNIGQVKTFIAVGANSFYKNYKMLIDTLNKLKSITNKEFRLIVVGHESNKGYSKPAEELILSFKNSLFCNDIRFVPSILHGDMPSVYNEADAFIMTSIQEGQPLVALEAACSGLPIFSTRCGGVEDYVDDKVGRLVDVMDSEKLAYYLKEFLENEISFDNEYIRKVVIEKYGKKEFIKIMHEAFESVMDK